MKRIHLVLSHSSIQDCIRQLEEYKNGLQPKLQKVADKLADIGVDVIQANLGEYGEFIEVKKELKESTPEQAKYIVCMINTQMVTKWWFRNGTLVHEDVNPVLMTEFGSGAYARNDFRSSMAGSGRGSFPNQRHAFDDEGWSWTTPDGKTHHSFGEEPSAPLYNAYWTMYMDVASVIREVFGNG